MTPTADAKINTSMPLFITADELIYSNDTSEINGKGNVVARSDDITIFSDSIYVNSNSGDAIAQGHVLAVQAGSSIYTDKLNYNFKTLDSYAEHVDVISSPWIVRGDKLKKQGVKTEIEKPVFTTCDKESPHFRMQASALNIYEGDKIESWNTVIFLGNIPVFYFPYFAQPLKGEKKPFDIQFGHNDYSGWYVNTLYNVAFNQYNNWGLGYNYMEKIGAAYVLNIAYGLNKDSLGTFNGSLTDDFKSTPRLRQWAFNFNHDQIINDHTRLNLRAASLSDSNMAATLQDTQGVDVFRHDFGASFSTAIGNNQSIGISIADTEQLTTNSRYYTAARSLPSFNYSLTSMPILPRLYYTHALTLNRSYNAQDGGGYYSDAANFTPSLSYSIPSFYILSLSANAGLTSSWQNTNENQKKFFAGDMVNSMNTSENASIDILPYGFLKANLTYAYSKMLNKLEGMPHAGITGNNASLSVNGGGGFISFNSSVTYDLLTATVKPGFDTDRLSMINFNANTTGGDIYFSANGLYSPYANMIKNLSFSFSLMDTGAPSMWSLSMMTNYVNNIMDTTGHQAITRTPDTMTFNSTLNFNFTPEFTFSINRQYDLILKQLTSESYAATWHLHCWEASISYIKLPGQVPQYFFTVFISAIPEAKFNKPTTAAPDYKLDDLMNQ